MPHAKLSRILTSALLLIHLLLFGVCFFTHQYDTRHPLWVTALAFFLFFPLWRLYKGKRWPLALYGITFSCLSYLSFSLCQTHHLSTHISTSIALSLCLVQYACLILFYLKRMRAWWPPSTHSIEKKKAFEAAIHSNIQKPVKPRSIRWGSYVTLINFAVNLALTTYLTLSMRHTHLLGTLKPGALIALLALGVIIFSFYIWRINLGERWAMYPALLLFVAKCIALLTVLLSGSMPEPYANLLINPLTLSIVSASALLSLIGFRCLFSSTARQWSRSLTISQVQYDVSQARDAGHSIYLVDPLKLSVMTIATFGFYLYHWFYRHWKAIQENENKPGKPSIMPIMRSLLQNLFIFPFLSRMHPKKRLSYTLSFYLFLLGILGAEKLSTAVMLVPLCIWLYIIQHRINTVARLSGVERNINHTYTWANGVFIALFATLILSGCIRSIIRLSI